jgi:hypothetical protein
MRVAWRIWKRVHRTLTINHLLYGVRHPGLCQADSCGARSTLQGRLVTLRLIWRDGMAIAGRGPVFYLPISTNVKELGTGLGRAVGFCGVAGTASFCSVAIEKIW